MPALELAWLSWWLGGAEWLGAYCLSTTLLFHGVACVNSIAHLFGTQPFATQDASRNNGWVALMTLGEGWRAAGQDEDNLSQGMGSSERLSPSRLDTFG